MKLNFYLKMILVFSIIAFAFGCKKSVPNTFTKNDLPSLNIGNWWRYRVVDSFNLQIDTLTLRVVSFQSTSVGHVYGCHMERSGRVVDTASFVYSVGDTTIDFTTDSLMASYRLRVPFSSIDYWSYRVKNTEVYVTDYIEGYKVLGENYNVFYLNYPYYGVIPAYYKFYIARDVGLVNMESTLGEPSGFHRKSQQLIDYSLN